MIVFKFGGASVKDAKAVKNVANVLSMYPNEKIVVVVSAMGKTTNLLEEVVNALWSKDIASFNYYVNEALKYHLGIVDQLFSESHTGVLNFLEATFTNLLDKSKTPLSSNYDFEYDQIVSLGEVISTYIVEAYLVDQTLEAAWLDARKLVITDSTYRNGTVHWELTQQAISETVPALFKTSKLLITQGFIGGSKEKTTVTLGREGSDYTAAIFAYCLDAQSVTIWKDVPGMLNADPKYFENTKKLDKISYKEALELSYYGASVIHPKTIKPLQNKGIPLYVKSFLKPLNEGTIIHANKENDKLIASFIVKHNQVLFSFTPNDFSFIVEENLSILFKGLSACSAKINLMQNSALSFSILLDELKINKEKILEYFKKEYTIKYNEGLELITIRHYDEQIISKMTKGKVILVEQKTRETARFVVKNKL